ncbi:dihydroorotate oxidase A [Palleronia marisminoris]|uniref:Dihydroorotate dehydrogenase (quinone) n=1 Tax=Palleronia marisminoris TaxID=315423 RepID=A0A1Y5SU22_9RHOB|nr:quinone-dependent dihydroorotate dehydrogenase [Palleronia marisminoris]SFG97841.1 dihydroorotate oxidase A [Palleronia marisminoris]SLN47873.1 Dihydroorotate dehydrogenase (quinone) [Palleronia marisminoris]
MSLSERLGLAALRRLDPELAHGLALKGLRLGFVPLPGPVTTGRLRTKLAGVVLPNPVGLAAGFDKNAEAVGPLSRAGFGFLELGAATPRPQGGNPKPRLFRLTEDEAAINRFGFNNAGVEIIARRLAAAKSAVPRGLNLGANKDSADRAADFATVLSQAAPHIDFATVNVSSPNTEKLRDLQGAEALRALLTGVMQANERGLPIFLKIAPDLDDQALADIAGVADETGIAGIVATNTTLSREGLRSPFRDQQGGLSGKPLFERSTRVLAKLSTLTKLPLIGVGGVSSAEEAYAKIRAGASAVQLYTAMVYGGVTLAAQITRELDDLLLQDGLIAAQAVGLDRDRWT